MRPRDYHNLMLYREWCSKRCTWVRVQFFRRRKS
jgi:hypothetical protein